MPLEIRTVSARDPQILALLQASHALMDHLFPPEENFALDVDALCAPQITLCAAVQDGAALGCAALSRQAGYAEVKSMFVAPEARGLGVARRLLAHLEDLARQEGILLLRLETGDKLAAAVALYDRMGFVRCGPFGSYVANSSSLFYEKPLT
ncbi:MAG TPA: GNAT family N-acetyltransferase [Citreicella sp.]|jgi:putative acetyltransferase|uniref:GNAT family N-acetyltransferase n=1 Tax=Salipiger marinus TaxID=555512 RepID=UPI000E9DAEEC|nr:GNAT family N-acetyltransferase [Citreicella sp.]HBS99794.1 GNAT family N-acetyltransferase [Citreicella sp.]